MLLSVCVRLHLRRDSSRSGHQMLRQVWASCSHRVTKSASMQRGYVTKEALLASPTAVLARDGFHACWRASNIPQACAPNEYSGTAASLEGMTCG